MSAQVESTPGPELCPRCSKPKVTCPRGCVAMFGQVYAEGRGWMEAKFAPAFMANGGRVDMEPFVDPVAKILLGAARRTSRISCDPDRCPVCDGRFCPADHCVAQPGDVHVSGIGWRSVSAARALESEGYPVHWEYVWSTGGVDG